MMLIAVSHDANCKYCKSSVDQTADTPLLNRCYCTNLCISQLAHCLKKNVYFHVCPWHRTEDVLTRPAEEFGNDATLEHLWAARAMEHSDIYFNVLCSVDTRWLRLTPHDDLILTHFRQDFPDLDVSYIKENEIKNNTNKAKWRVFCDKFKNIVEDYSFGTLMRADAKGDYSEQNTMLVPRVQFYAIEIARNRENLNNEVKKHFKCASKAIMEAQELKAELTA